VTDKERVLIIDNPISNIDKFVMNHLRRSRGGALGIPDFLGSPQVDIDKFVMKHARHTQA
jgi:hypothetical protein